MTLPSERRYAVDSAREFLYRLLDPKKTPRVPLTIRKEACDCLRHYPYEAAWFMDGDYIRTSKREKKL